MCHICGLNSENPAKVKEHLKRVHNIQVEDEIRDSFKCPQCIFINNDMTEMKKHMVGIHNNDEWNWGWESEQYTSVQSVRLSSPQSPC